MLTIKITPIPSGTEAALIKRSGDSDTYLDQVAGETDYVLKIVQEWVQITENLTTTKNI